MLSGQKEAAKWGRVQGATVNLPFLIGSIWPQHIMAGAISLISAEFAK
jgi:hypothetical protein